MPTDHSPLDVREAEDVFAELSELRRQLGLRKMRHLQRALVVDLMEEGRLDRSVACVLRYRTPSPGVSVDALLLSELARAVVSLPPEQFRIAWRLFLYDPARYETSGEARDSPHMTSSAWREKHEPDLLRSVAARLARPDLRGEPDRSIRAVPQTLLPLAQRPHEYVATKSLCVSCVVGHDGLPVLLSTTKTVTAQVDGVEYCPVRQFYTGRPISRIDPGSDIVAPRFVHGDTSRPINTYLLDLDGVLRAGDETEVSFLAPVLDVREPPERFFAFYGDGGHGLASVKVLFPSDALPERCYLGHGPVHDFPFRTSEVPRVAHPVSDSTRYSSVDWNPPPPHELGLAYGAWWIMEVE